MVKKEVQNNQGSYVVDFSGLDPSLGPAQFEKKLRKHSSQRCTMVPEIVSFSGPGVIVDCKDPYLQEWVLQLSKRPHTNGYTMKVEQRRPRLQPEDIYALAHKDVSEREPLDRLNRGDKTTVTYTLRPSPHKAAVNAVNVDTTTDPNTAEPTDTSVNAVGHPRPLSKKTADPGLNRHLRINAFGFRVPKIGSNVNKPIWTTILIGVSPIAPFRRVDAVPHAMTPIGQFLRNTIGPPKGVSLRVVNLKAVVRIRAVWAIKGEKERGRW